MGKLFNELIRGRVINYWEVFIEFEFEQLDVCDCSSDKF